jgi:YD repeat-containing protein
MPSRRMRCNMSVGAAGFRTLICGIGITAASVAGAAPADVDRTLDLLKQTTVLCADRTMSALDCGLLDVNARLVALRDSTGADLTAVYDEADRRVEVRAVAIDTIHATSDNCSEVVNHVRYDAGFDGRSGVRLLAPLTRYARALVQGSTAAATSAGHAIDGALAVEVIIEYDDQRMTCQGRLLDTDVAFPS